MERKFESQPATTTMMTTTMRRSSIQLAPPHHQPKIITASAANFERINGAEDLRYYDERPMLLNAWTQTCGDDFELLHVASSQKDQHQQWQEQQQNEERNKTVLQLLEKIRLLEESLRAHSDILTQLHTTTAATNGSTSGNTLAISLEQQREQREREREHEQRYQHQHRHQQEPQRLHLKMEAANLGASASVTPSPALPPVKEAVKYTIIAEGHDDGSGCEPIEIQLAEEDGGLNLNSSADSGRLEICLAEEAEVKTTTRPQAPTPAQLSNGHDGPRHTSEQVIKRRRLSNYYLNQENMVMTMVQQPMPQQHQHQQQLNASCTSLGVVSSSAAVTAQHSPAVIVRHQHGQSLLKQPKAEPIETTNMAATPTPLPLHNRSYPSGGAQQSKPEDLADNVMVSIGPNNTRIPAKLYETMSWSSASIATRKLLMAIFNRETLATHSMTGKPSPAFKDHGKPLKQMLDPHVIQDIIFAVTRKCNVSDKEVRNAITTKCADENKMMKLQLNKNRSLREVNKENVG